MWVLETCLTVGLLPLNHLDHCFVVFKHLTKLLDAKIGRLREQRST